MLKRGKRKWGGVGTMLSYELYGYFVGKRSDGREGGFGQVIS